MDSKRLAFVVAGVMLITVCGICTLCIFPALFFFSPIRSNVRAYDPASENSQSGEAKSSTGEALFEELGCSACHRPDGFGPGPSLVGLYNESVELEDGSTVIADEEYLRRSILDSKAEIVAGYPPIMPAFDSQVSEDEAGLLIEYIQSLGE